MPGLVLCWHGYTASRLGDRSVKSNSLFLLHNLCTEKTCQVSANTHSVVPVWFYFWWNITSFNQVGGKKKVGIQAQFTNQLQHTSSKLKQATFDQNTWADTLLCADLSEMTTLKRCVNPRTPASQLSPPFLSLHWVYYFLMAYNRNKSPHWITREVQSQPPHISLSHLVYFSAKPHIVCTAHAEHGSEFLVLQPNLQCSSGWLAARNIEV